MLKEISQFQQMLWLLNIAVAGYLLVLLGVRKNYRIFPAFSLYILLNLALGILAFVLYRRWGFFSQEAWRIAWGMQALVLCARAAAVAEVCKHLLGRYRGVWALAWRVLLACAAIVLLYSSLAARLRFTFALPKAERSLELAIATVIVAVFVFARHYGVEAQPADRSLAVGFCLYSCFGVLNNTILDRFLDSYVPLWNLLGMLAYLGSLFLWSWALREKLPEREIEPKMLPKGVYRTLTPEINERLEMLNENLKQFWYPEVRRP